MEGVQLRRADCRLHDAEDVFIKACAHRYDKVSSRLHPKGNSQGCSTEEKPRTKQAKHIDSTTQESPKGTPALVTKDDGGDVENGCEGNGGLEKVEDVE